MSKCMTIDETVDPKDTRTDITAKDIVEFVLEEALHSAVIISDKGYSRIGDFNVAEDFCQQFDQPLRLKDFERVNDPSTTGQESHPNSGEKAAGHSASLPTAKDNLEVILDSFASKENAFEVISEDVLADNELRIQNGQIRLERNATESLLPGPASHESPEGEDLLGTKIEIEYYNEGKLNKIYVPLSNLPTVDPARAPWGPRDPGPDRRPLGRETVDEGAEDEKEGETPFALFGSGQLGGVSSEEASDPNRPRACATSEEEVKKMTKEIEDINFNQSRSIADDLDVAYHTDGQGDVDLKSKSFADRSKDGLEKASKGFKFHEDVARAPKVAPESASLLVKSIDDLGEPFCGPKELEVFSSEKQDQEKEEELILDNVSFYVSEGKRLQPEVSDAEECSFCSSRTELSASASKGKVFPSSDHSKSGSTKPRWSEGTGRAEDEDLNRERSRGARNADEVPDFSPFPESERTSPFDSRLSPSGSVPRDNCFEYRIFQTDSENMAEFLNREAAFEDFDSAPSCSRYKNDHPGTPFKESESCSGSGFEKRPEMKSKSANDAPQNHSLEFTLVSPGASSLGPCSKTKNEVDEEPFDFATVPEDEGLRFDSEESSFPLERGRGGTRNAGVPLVETGASRESVAEPRGTSHYGDDPYLLPEKIDERLAESFRTKNLECTQDTNETCTENILSASQSQHDGECEYGGDAQKADESGNEEAAQRPFLSSQTRLDEEPPVDEGDTDEAAADSLPKSVKLRSQKMYSGMNFAPASSEKNEFALTDSEEALIDSTESVLQIIEPRDEDDDDADAKVSFSQPSEGSPSASSEPLPTNNDRFLREQEDGVLPGKILSGMSTMGPIKHADRDPKDLTGPEVDFGKMTRITSSRQLGKDFFGTEMTASPSRKILEGEDSDDEDDDGSANVEGDRLEVTSLVNRDIASLTKVQKVRQVMSHHPRPDEYFEDEDTLTRSRLDLKDVESMTDERYKVPDVGIPMLSFEVGDNPEADKECIQNMNFVLTGTCFSSDDLFEDDLEEAGLEPEDYVRLTGSFVRSLGARSSRSLAKEGEEGFDGDDAAAAANSAKEADGGEAQATPESVSVAERDSRREEASRNPKCGTLGSVFKKASSKLIRKDGDLLLRNSKSLPRDAAKPTARTDSFRCMLDDCQASASNILKKSRSMLKNTQSLFKTISQNRFGVHESDDGGGVPKEKVSDTHVPRVERKSASFLRKEDFAKAKNLIKSKMGKTSEHAERTGAPASQADVPAEEADLRIVVRHEESFRVDRMENFRKLLPKTPLVYKSQFVKNQTNAPNVLPEAANVGPNREADAADEGDQEVSGEAAAAESEESAGEGAPSAKETANEREASGFPRQEEEPRPEQPEYIVMETVEGLPAPDLENPSSGVERGSQEVREGPRPEGIRGGNDVRTKTAAASSENDVVCDVAPRFPEKEGNAAAKTPPDRKGKTKQKKFATRFRSFWCSAFGKVKTPAEKTDLP